LILANNDPGGAIAVQRRILAEEWAEFSVALTLRFVEFADVSLARGASDHAIWQTCLERIETLHGTGRLFIP
jgi:hypothetical protein